jgi:acetolactate synthase-1/2/3 large subunit
LTRHNDQFRSINRRVSKEEQQMLTTANQRSGGEILVDTLRIHGVDTVFCVPGESFLAAIDALGGAREAIQTVVTRHEAGAAHMADAYGKLTGKPGICFVTRGPGASHAAIGVHTASQDSTPMILFIGQVARGMLGREAWQEVDFRKMFGGMAKWVVEIDRAERIPELVSRAFHVAVSGRPGPVVVSLPEDMLAEQVKAPNSAPYTRAAAHPGAAELSRLVELIDGAERPLVIVGGGGWNAAACEHFKRFVETFNLPVVAGFRRQDILDNRHSHYVGHAGIGPSPTLVKRIQDADLIIAIGGRLGETTTSGYTLFEIPRPAQRFVHVHADPNELGRVYQADLSINAGMPEIAEALAGLRPSERYTPETQARRRVRLAAARDEFVADQTPGTMPGLVDLGAVMRYLRDALPADAIISNGAGNYAIWVHKFYPYGGFRTQLAPTSGAMGYGLPAAIAAKLVHQDRTAVCFAGDGCFLMSANELATASRYNLGVIVIVVNNGMYGSIRMHQEKEYPGRVHATALENPDFVALARSFGSYGEEVLETGEFGAAFARAKAYADDRRKPALLELKIDAEAITPSATLTQLRQRALASQDETFR